MIDLCADRDEDGLAALLADALSSRRTTTERLLTEVRRRTRVRHRKLLCEVLGDVSVGAHSALERRFLLNVERAHGLPCATRQAHARTKHRSDAWYEEFGLLVELDSKLHHSGGAAFHDMTRDNDHALAGLTTLRFGWGTSPVRRPARPRERWRRHCRRAGGRVLSRHARTARWFTRSSSWEQNTV